METRISIMEFEDPTEGELSDLCSPKEAAYRLGISVSELRNRNKRGLDPMPVSIGQQRFYRIAEVDRVVREMVERALRKVAEDDPDFDLEAALKQPLKLH
jgi:hypothetical protein